MISFRHLAYIFIGLIIGILSGRYGFFLFLPVYCVYIFLGVVSVFSPDFYSKKLPGIFVDLNKNIRKQNALLIAIGFIMIPLGAYLYHDSYDNSIWYMDVMEDGTFCEVWGKVDDIKIKNGNTTLTLSKCVVKKNGRSYDSNKILLFMGDGEFSPKIGSSIYSKGEISIFDTARNPGNFDFREYYNGMGIDFMVMSSYYENDNGNYNHFMDFLYCLKMKIRAVFEDNLTESEYGILSMMVLGDRTHILDEDKQLYRECGLSHILAISGLHVSILGSAIFGGLRKRGVNVYAAGLASGFFIVSFGLLAGMGIATQRAIIMYLTMLWSNIPGKDYDPINALSLAGMIILCQNPLLLFSASFQMSFMAVLGAVWVFPKVFFMLNTENKMMESLMLCICIQVVTLPLSLFYYFEIPTYAMLLNFILLPMVSILLTDGMAGGLLGVFAYGTILSKIVLFPAHLILSFYDKVLKIFSNLPYAHMVAGQPKTREIILYYGILLISILVLENLNLKSFFVERRKDEPLRNIKNTIRTAALACGYYLSVVMFSLRMEKVPSITMLDVGQGDGILVETGGEIFFFDGGSTDVKNVGKYRIEPALKSMGIGKIDYWFLSHTDEDHYNGILEIMEDGYEVKNLVLAKGMVMDESGKNIIDEAYEHDAEVYFFSPGDMVENGGATFTCIFPKAQNDYDDKNDASLVIRYDQGNVSTLITGDLGEVGEVSMLEEGILDEIDILKVGHHGSKFSSSENFLEKLNPDIAIISAGEENRYGHPSGETLERLEAKTDQIYVTQDEGAVTIEIDDETLSVSTFLGH